MPQIFQGAAGLVAERFFDEALGDLHPAGFAAKRVGVRVAKLAEHVFLLIRRQAAELGDLNGDRLDLLGIELGEQHSRLVLRQAGKQDGGFTKFGRHG